MKFRKKYMSLYVEADNLRDGRLVQHLFWITSHMKSWQLKRRSCFPNDTSTMLLDGGHKVSLVHWSGWLDVYLPRCIDNHDREWRSDIHDPSCQCQSFKHSYFLLNWTCVLPEQCGSAIISWLSSLARTMSFCHHQLTQQSWHGK